MIFSKFTSKLLLAGAVAGASACVAPADASLNKEDEFDAPVDGKLDGASIINHGDLAWDIDDEHSYYGDFRHALSPEQPAHALTFALSGSATLSFETGPQTQDGADLDTVMYLYKQGTTGTWGRYIERNDDIAEHNYWSRLEDLELEEGNYRIVVKGYSRAEAGDFRLHASCQGAGCTEVGSFVGNVINEVGPAANYSSESDYSPVFVSGDFPPRGRLSVSTFRTSLGEDVAAFFASDSETAVSVDDLAFEMWSVAETNEFFNDVCEAGEDDHSSAQAWQQIRESMSDNLTGIRGFKVGPADENGDMLTDRGLYAYVVVGLDENGKLAGFLVGVVHT
jgi:hypothetical protein